MKIILNCLCIGCSQVCRMWACSLFPSPGWNLLGSPFSIPFNQRAAMRLPHPSPYLLHYTSSYPLYSPNSLLIHLLSNIQYIKELTCWTLQKDARLHYQSMFCWIFLSIWIAEIASPIDPVPFFSSRVLIPLGSLIKAPSCPTISLSLLS